MDSHGVTFRNNAQPPKLALLAVSVFLELFAAVAAASDCVPQISAEAILPGGTFLMGAEPMHPEEGPPIQVTIEPFSIDRTEVTNADFAAFIAETGYVTSAERNPDPKLYPGVRAQDLKPSSLIFIAGGIDAAARGGWRVVEGADWRHPEGPGSSITGREHHPVVHVSWDDAMAYAEWKGRDLPTEAEWEYAARGGLDAARYTWGDHDSDSAHPMANTWQGTFPAVDSGADGFAARAAPVGCFPPNGFELYDMAGNVWEWTRDWYRPGISGAIGASEADAYDPHDPATPKHVIKGGSYLCGDNFCYRYRPSARQPGPPDTGASHIGFRTVRRAK